MKVNPTQSSSVDTPAQNQPLSPNSPLGGNLLAVEPARSEPSENRLATSLSKPALDFGDVISRLDDPQQLAYIEDLKKEMAIEDVLNCLAPFAKRFKTKAFGNLIALALKTSGSTAAVVILRGLADLTPEQQELLVKEIVDAADKLPHLIFMMIDAAARHQQPKALVAKHLPSVKNSLPPNSLKKLMEDVKKNENLDSHWKGTALAALAPQLASKSNEPMDRSPAGSSPQASKPSNDAQTRRHSAFPPAKRRHYLDL